MIFSARKPDISMPRVKGVRHVDLHDDNGYAMIAFISTKAMGERKEREPT